VSPRKRDRTARPPGSATFEVRSGSDWDFFVAGAEAAVADRSKAPSRNSEQSGSQNHDSARNEPVAVPTPEAVLAQLTRMVERLEAAIVRLEIQESQRRKR